MSDTSHTNDEGSDRECDPSGQSDAKQSNPGNGPPTLESLRKQYKANEATLTSLNERISRFAVILVSLKSPSESVSALLPHFLVIVAITLILLLLSKTLR
jgi:hypothetical protein